MLTGDLAMSWRRGKSISPRYIDAGDASYLRVAEDLVSIFREHEGRRRGELDEELEEYVGSGTDYKILRGLIKLLSDRCNFETGSTIDPAEIRRALFLKARAHHPVSGPVREQLIAEVAGEFACEPESLAVSLYADLVANQKLISFEPLTAGELLDSYNLAQAQALLYRSVEMRIRVEPQEQSGYRRLFDAIKYYRLIHSIRGSATAGYEVRLSGPVSIFHRSQKYGIQMAVFLPALLGCRGWSMRAEIDLKERGSAFFDLDSRQTRLRSQREELASTENLVAERLLAKWDLRGDWSLSRSGEVIDLAGSVFIPDLIARHPLGKKVYIEVLGFWTPKYLTERLTEFEHAGFKDFLFAASEELRGSREAALNTPPNVLLFKSALDARELRSALDNYLR